MKSALLFGSEDHDHLTAFELGRMLDLSNIDKLLTDAVHELSAELLVSHFASAEAQRDLGLVAVLKEALQAAQFRLEVVLIRGRTELDFLDLDDFLLGLGFLSLLLLLIAELAVIHQTADRRDCVGRNLDQIHPCILSHAEGFGCADDPDLGAIDAGQSDFRNSDLTIDPMLAILSYGSSPKN